MPETVNSAAQPQPETETPPPQPVTDLLAQPANMPIAAEIFRQALDRSEAIHAQALQDMQQRSQEVHEQLATIMQQRISTLLLPKFAFIQRASQLDEGFWPGIVASAKQVLREHGEYPPEG